MKESDSQEMHVPHIHVAIDEALNRAMVVGKINQNTKPCTRPHFRMQTQMNSANTQRESKMYFQLTIQHMCQRTWSSTQAHQS